MTVSVFPIGETVRMIERMEIRDGKSICGILQGLRRLTGATNVPEGRSFRFGFDRCIRTECDGLPSEISHYERNNWVTAEMRCGSCGTRFTVKAEM